MSKRTLMGSLLAKIQRVRQQAKDDAANELWKRNGLDNPARRDGHIIASDTTVTRDGAEVTTVKLWKLVDKTVVTLGSDINITSREGVEKGDEYSNRATPENNTSSPI